MESVTPVRPAGNPLVRLDGTPTKRGLIELRIAEIVARGATRENAEYLASLRIFKTKKGKWAFYHGSNGERNTASPLEAREIALLGLAERTVTP